ncbi:MAG: adenine phosphoribosyltransferase [Bifidobacteriaceae bacterium]|jgi:adenine phosphoribosyltransferase|nr:adenine phosphoribosyltransferase [Bifidobacteriaceae bacterium]
MSLEANAPVSSLVEAHVRDIPDFPKPGVLYKDITPLLSDAYAFGQTVQYLGDLVERMGAQLVVGIEARGFILAAPAAMHAGLGFVPLRKPGKLPGVTLRESYALEYGEATLEMHEDAIRPGTRVVLMDDVLATGGTAAAAAELLERSGAKVVGLSFLMELASLRGRAKLPGRNLDCILTVP